MYDVKLTINGEEFPVHYKLLCQLARFLPDDAKYLPILRALVALEIPSITYELADKEVLTIEERDKLWEKGDRQIKRLLADESKFRKNLTDAQAEEIIELNDSEILSSIAGYCEQLYPSSDDEQAMRLSGKMADQLLEFLLKHPNDNVRDRLAGNSDTPAKFRIPVSEMIENGMDAFRSTGEMLTEADLEALPKANAEMLKSIANSVEHIKDREVRQKVIDFLCASPDPAVRMELAENSWAPKSALEKLVNDPDADVALAARRTLDD